MPSQRPGPLGFPQGGEGQTSPGLSSIHKNCTDAGAGARGRQGCAGRGGMDGKMGSGCQGATSLCLYDNYKKLLLS